MKQLPKALIDLLQPLKGKRCCGAYVGDSNSLSLWFGKKVPSNPRVKVSNWGEYGVGTYDGIWTIIDNQGLVICDSREGTESFLNKIVGDIAFGSFMSLSQDVSSTILIYTDDIRIEFRPENPHDEFCHFFLPHDVYVEYTLEGGWRSGTSSGSWEGGIVLT